MEKIKDSSIIEQNEEAEELDLNSYNIKFEIDVEFGYEEQLEDHFIIYNIDILTKYEKVKLATVEIVLIDFKNDDSYFLLDISEIYEMLVPLLDEEGYIKDDFFYDYYNKNSFYFLDSIQIHNNLVDDNLEKIFIKDIFRIIGVLDNKRAVFTIPKSNVKEKDFISQYKKHNFKFINNRNILILGCLPYIEGNTL